MNIIAPRSQNDIKAQPNLNSISIKFVCVGHIYLWVTPALWLEHMCELQCNTSIWHEKASPLAHQRFSSACTYTLNREDFRKKYFLLNFHHQRNLCLTLYNNSTFSNLHSVFSMYNAKHEACLVSCCKGLLIILCFTKLINNNDIFICLERNLGI